MCSRRPLRSEQEMSLLLANPPGAAGPSGPQEPALFSMGGMFALLGLEAKAHFSQDDENTSRCSQGQGWCLWLGFMCRIRERFLLAKKVLKNLSPGVGARIQPGIKALVDGKTWRTGEKRHGGGQREGTGAERGSSRPSRGTKAEQQEVTPKGRLGPQPMAP